jgi:hypothetical protein
MISVNGEIDKTAVPEKHARRDSRKAYDINEVLSSFER